MVRIALLNAYASTSSRVLLQVPDDVDVAELRRHALTHHHVDLTAAKLIYHGQVLQDTQKLAAIFTDVSSPDAVHTILVWTPPPAVVTPPSPDAASASPEMSAADYWMWHTQMNMATEFQYGYDPNAFAHALAHAQAHLEALRHASEQSPVSPLVASEPSPVAAPPPQQPEQQPARVRVPVAHEGGEARAWALLDLRLALKLVFVVLLFGQSGDNTRLFTLIAVAIGVYLYQVGAFQVDRQPQQQQQQQPREAVGAPAEAREGGEQMAQEVVSPIRTGPLVAVEKFIVGLFASLLPGWQPGPQRQPPPPPQ